MNCSPPLSSVYGILQARLLEWAAVPFPLAYFFGSRFHKTAWAFLSTHLGESRLRGDSSEKRWNGSMSTSGFKDSGLRSQLSHLTRGGLAGEHCDPAPGRPHGAYMEDGVESHERERASWQAPAGVMGISIGMSFEWLPCRGLVRPSDTTYSTGDEVGEGAPLELNEIKIDSPQSLFAPCFPHFGNLICIFMIVVSWPPVWSKFNENKRDFHRKKGALINVFVLLYEMFNLFWPHWVLAAS